MISTCSFKLEASALSEGPYGDLGIPMFGDLHRKKLFVKFRYEYALLAFDTSGMILEEVIKQMVEW